MALQDLESDIQAVRNEAERVSTRALAARKEIDSDETLSDVGKQQLLEGIRDSAKSSMRELREKEEGLLRARAVQLESRLDGFVGYSNENIIAFRDAQDRAEQLTEPEAADRMLARAMRTNDRSLAHAIYRRALDARWSSVIKTFTAENPTLADVGKDLHDIEDTLADSMSRSMHYGIGLYGL